MQYGKNVAKLNLTQAAKATGKDRSTIHRHIKKGKISCEIDTNGNKVIDTAELQRAYGEIKNIATPATIANNNLMQGHAISNATSLFHEKISNLEEEVKELKEDRDHWRKQADKLLLTHEPNQQSTSNSILFALCLLSTILIIFLTVIFFYRG